jgi:hypothetical protein
VWRRIPSNDPAPAGQLTPLAPPTKSPATLPRPETLSINSVHADKELSEVPWQYALASQELRFASSIPGSLDPLANTAEQRGAIATQVVCQFLEEGVTRDVCKDLIASTRPCQTHDAANFGGMLGWRVGRMAVSSSRSNVSQAGRRTIASGHRNSQRPLKSVGSASCRNLWPALIASPSMIVRRHEVCFRSP